MKTKITCRRKQNRQIRSASASARSCQINHFWLFLSLNYCCCLWRRLHLKHFLWRKQKERKIDLLMSTTSLAACNRFNACQCEQNKSMESLTSPRSISLRITKINWERRSGKEATKEKERVSEDAPLMFCSIWWFCRTHFVCPRNKFSSCHCLRVAQRRRTWTFKSIETKRNETILMCFCCATQYRLIENGSTHAHTTKRIPFAVFQRCFSN